jgi:hypothetical protein
VLPLRGGFWTKGIHSSFVLFKRTRFDAMFLRGGYLCSKVVKNSSMPKGAKYGGRSKGVPNKVSSELKEVLSSYCLNEFQYLNANIERLTLSERLVFFLKVLPFVLPKNGVPEANTGEAAKVPIIIFSDKK